jgi:glycosyltransferase involved in cell wall biosynthesis
MKMSYNKSDSMNYILVTPMKNEEENIDFLVKSIINQEIKPKLWIIVNDNSEDNSKKKLLKYEKKHDWIKVIDFPKKIKNRKLGLHISEVYIFGQKYAVNYCKTNNISFNYIGVVDGDIILEKKYFKKLILRFIQDKKLGIASGSSWSFDGSKYISQKDRFDEPPGAFRLIRKKCFEDINGYLITHSADTVSNIKARLKGWKTRCFRDLKAKQIRMTSSAEGMWRGCVIIGEGDYFLYSHPMYIFMRMMKLSSNKRFYLGFAYLSGYLKAFINKEKRISDKQIITYFKNQHLKYLIHLMIRK